MRKERKKASIIRCLRLLREAREEISKHPENWPELEDEIDETIASFESALDKLSSRFNWRRLSDAVQLARLILSAFSGDSPGE